MSYTITNTSGATIATVADGSIDSTSTSLTLIGKNYAGYGVFLNDNYVKLLENFSNGASPTSPLNGQIWFDSTNRILKLYDTVSTQWKSICASSTSLTQPSNPIVGDLWWDISNNQLKAYGGSNWVLIGPTYTTSSGQSGAIVETIVDTNSVSHIAIKFYVQNSVIAVVSKDSSYTPQTAISGYSTINPGINLISSSTIAGSAFNGSVTNSLAVGGITSDKLLRNDTSGQISGSLNVVNNNGLTVGGSNNFNIGINSLNQSVNLTNSQIGADVNFYISSSGQGLVRLLTLSGSTGQVLLPNSIVSTSSTTGALVVTGGVGIGDALNVGANATISSATTSTSSTTGALVVTGGLGVGGSVNFGTTANIGTNLNVNGYANLNSGYSSTSVSSGALIVNGGAGISGNLNVGGDIRTAGNITAGFVYGTVVGNVQSVITTLGTLTHLEVDGPTQFLSNVLYANGAISSTSTTTGTIIINGTGGLGVGGNIYATRLNSTTATIGTVTAGTIVASANNASNIGSATSGFNYLYAGNIMPTSNQVGNIGSSSAYYNRVFATSTSALYSDLAERFYADEIYTPGTVVEIGGINEITQVINELSNDVFGVISTAPAYLMNNQDGIDEYHPPVALQGRVPVRVVGQVSKGDRLVSAGNGCARRGLINELTAFNVIGRSLVDKTTENEELIVAIVKAIS